jgi:hypothetical protein
VPNHFHGWHHYGKPQTRFFTNFRQRTGDPALADFFLVLLGNGVHDFFFAAAWEHVRRARGPEAKPRPPLAHEKEPRYRRS